MVNRQNYLRARAHLDHLHEVMQLDEASVRRYWFYLRHLLLWADETSFSQAPVIRPTFPTYLTETDSGDQTELLAPTTLKKVVQSAQRFFKWAKMAEPREFREVPAMWIESLRLPRLPCRATEHSFVTLDGIRQIARLSIPEDDLALRRDQAFAVMLYVSGMRAGALGTLPIQAVDVAQRGVKQWPSLGVHTKNGKSATTYWLPIPDLLAVVESWDVFVREQLPPTAMWCPPVHHVWGEQTLTANAPGANRNVALNKRLRKLFALADLPHQSPHKFRHGHAVWALQHAQTMADYKAISQNLMHSDIRVTDGIYAPLLGDEVQQRVASLAGQASHPLPTDGDLAAFLSRLSKREVAEALHILAEGIAH